MSWQGAVAELNLPNTTSIKYMVNPTSSIYLMELGRWICICIFFKGEFSCIARIPTSNDNILCWEFPTIQHRAIKLPSLDSLGSCESINVCFKTTKMGNHELYHFEGDRNTRISQFRSLTSHRIKARETKTQLSTYQFGLICFIFKQCTMSNLNSFKHWTLTKFDKNLSARGCKEMTLLDKIMTHVARVT